MKIWYETPFFEFNGCMSVLLKYSTRGRSPWGFTFTGDEQALLQARALRSRITIGLVCGSDGIAAFSYEQFLTVAPLHQSAVHIACYRAHGELYEVKGPEGKLDRKVSPANWLRILELRAT